MRALLIFWFLPTIFFWGWYYLSLNDMHFGTDFFSIEMHRLVMHVYGEVLSKKPAEVPAILAKTYVFDTFLLAGLVAFRRRKQIMEWWRNRRQPVEITRDEPLMFDPAAPESGRVLPAE